MMARLEARMGRLLLEAIARDQNHFFYTPESKPQLFLA